MTAPATASSTNGSFTIGISGYNNSTMQISATGNKGSSLTSSYNNNNNVISVSGVASGEVVTITISPKTGV